METQTPEHVPSAERIPALNGASHALLSTLPLLYIAWADGLLAPSQIEEIESHIAHQAWIPEADREQLCAWLDPQDPPSAAEHHGWLRAIRRAAEHIPGAAGKPLAELGVEMAKVAGTEGDGAFPTPEALTALREIEAALGIVGHEAARELLQERPAPDGSAREPRFDVEAMTRLLDRPHGELRQRIRTLLRDPVFRYEPQLGQAAYRERVFQWAELLAEQGLGALAFPEEYGGEGDIGKFIAAFETLAYHDLSLVVKFGVQFGLFGGSIQQLGTERHHEKYLRRIGSLELPGCFAMSELGHGSNVRELETTARYDADAEEFVINTPSNAARKEWIGNAAVHGEVATVFAQLEIGGEDYGVHAFVVPIRDKGGVPRPRVRITDNGPKMGLNGVDNGRLWFDNVRVPRENMLDRFATVEADGTYRSPIPSAGKRFFTMLSTLVGGRISVAAAGLSAAKSGLTIAVRYGEKRRQFGPKDEPETPLLDYLSHQRRLLPLVANAYALDFALTDLAGRFARHRSGDDLREIEGLAAGLKAVSTWNTTKTLQTAREACGGQGYLTLNRLPRLKADTDVFTTFEGDNTVLMLQVAKGLLSDFKQEFEDMNFFGMVRYLGGEVRGRITEQNPLVTRNTDREHLRSAAFQRSAFEARADDLVRSAAQRLRARIQEGVDSYEAFIEVQDHLLTMAEAHVEHVILERFIEGVERCEDEGLREVLTPLRSLFALWHIEKNRGWFLEQGYLEGRKAKAIRAEVNALCGEIRPLAVDLVNAFGIPDELIAAPIALGDPMHGG